MMCRFVIVRLRLLVVPVSARLLVALVLSPSVLLTVPLSMLRSVRLHVVAVLPLVWTALVPPNDLSNWLVVDMVWNAQAWDRPGLGVLRAMANGLLPEMDRAYLLGSLVRAIVAALVGMLFFPLPVGLNFAMTLALFPALPYWVAMLARLVTGACRLAWAVVFRALLGRLVTVGVVALLVRAVVVSAVVRASSTCPLTASSPELLYGDWRWFLRVLVRAHVLECTCGCTDDRYDRASVSSDGLGDVCWVVPDLNFAACVYVVGTLSFDCAAECSVDDLVVRACVCAVVWFGSDVVSTLMSVYDWDVCACCASVVWIDSDGDMSCASGVDPDVCASEVVGPLEWVCSTCTSFAELDGLDVWRGPGRWWRGRIWRNVGLIRR